MTTVRMAKCEKYKYSFCTHKHDAPECKKCVLVQRHGQMYKIINGEKHKKCPQCGEYKPMSDFRVNANGNISWCIECTRQYNKERKYYDDKSFLITHRKGLKVIRITVDSTSILMRYVKQCIDEGTKMIEIKQV